MINFFSRWEYYKFEIGKEEFACNFGIFSGWLSGVITNENGCLIWIVKVGLNENGRHGDYILQAALDNLSDNEPAVKSSKKQSMNYAVKHNSYNSRNTVAVRTPNNGNDTINDNNNQTLPDKNYTLCITNTNSLHINKTNGLC